MTTESTVRRGSSGPAVQRLQETLASLGFDPGGIDGTFGPGTEQAVRAFQTAQGLAADGVVGPNTWQVLLGGGGTTGSATGQPQPEGYVATLFSFQVQSGEAIGDRIVRCCEEALSDGPMGEHERHDFYRDFIACNQEISKEKADALTGVRTSCAMFVRAVRHWCGASPAGPYIPGTGMFKSMGNVSFGHPAFVANDGSMKPNPGDNFYISSTKESNDGHTGIFIEEISEGVWRTAEGGGGDGTQCRLGERTIVGNKFSNDARTLWGWFDCTKVGLPAA